jgi:hypothetical protein
MFKAIATAAVLVSLAAPALASDVQFMRMPGASQASPMPAEPLFSKIAARIDRGDAPAYITVSAAKIKKACGMSAYGCVVDMMGMKVMYLWDGLKGKAKRLTLIHETAHLEYDWDH